MNSQILSTLLYCYGFFLILCGIISVVFVGSKAKTALISGGTSGLFALVIGYFISSDLKTAKVAGIILSLALFIVFAWRSTKTFLKIFELIQLDNNEELKGKGIAFLIISLMAIVSIFVLIIQLISY